MPVMNPAELQQHLAQAERHAAEVKRLIARQEGLIANLAKGGHDTTDARKVMETLRDTQAIHDADVRRLLEALQAASQPVAQ
ncbi:MAG TPA: hypothetical protein VIM62_11130 [Acidobacteriaceae bacterium]